MTSNGLVFGVFCYCLWLALSTLSFMHTYYIYVLKFHNEKSFHALIVFCKLSMKTRRVKEKRVNGWSCNWIGYDYSDDDVTLLYCAITQLIKLGGYCGFGFCCSIFHFDFQNYTSDKFIPSKNKVLAKFTLHSFLHEQNPEF